MVSVWEFSGDLLFISRVGGHWQSHGVAFSPDGKCLTVACPTSGWGDDIKSFDATSGQEAFSLPSRGATIGHPTTGKKAATKVSTMSGIATGTPRMSSAAPISTASIVATSTTPCT